VGRRYKALANSLRLTDDKPQGVPCEADTALEERREMLKGRLKSLQHVREVELCDITLEQAGLVHGSR